MIGLQIFCTLLFLPWGADDTDALIAILQKYNAPATFFVVGEWVDKYPDEVKKLSEAGNDVMNHSATHPYMTSLSEAQMKEQLETCNGKIEAITGKRPTLFRCPYGDYDNRVVSTVESIGMKTYSGMLILLTGRIQAPLRVLFRG